MPTTRPRHMITETDDIAAMLDAAAARWPNTGGDRKQLLLRLLQEGSAAVDEGERDRQRHHRESVRHHAGMLSDIYDPVELSRLREDWPQ
ncbi:MAG: hypothetical protein M3519_07200 [Actinomycetota bacterium]|nr:hypothetical protein [Actinomycetota bacterium]